MKNQLTTKDIERLENTSFATAFAGQGMYAGADAEAAPTPTIGITIGISGIIVGTIGISLDHCVDNDPPAEIVVESDGCGDSRDGCVSYKGDCDSNEGYCVTFGGDCRSVDGDCRSMEGYCPSMDGGDCRSVDGDCRSMDGECPSLDGECNSVECTDGDVCLYVQSECSCACVQIGDCVGGGGYAAPAANLFGAGRSVDLLDVVRRSD